MDANLSPGTRIHFVEVPKSNYQNLHIDSVGLRTPSDSGLDEYQLSNDGIPNGTPVLCSFE
jgi:glyoxalase family protein